MAANAATTPAGSELQQQKDHLLELANKHACSSHKLFDFLQETSLNNQQVAALLRNYDAHASVLRRLLLNAAGKMPEAAVTYILENVRNEYGNGDFSANHQGQLRSLAWDCGVSAEEFFSAKIHPDIGAFIKGASQYYAPSNLPKNLGRVKKAAITAGAITATELLAIKEFAFLQKAFSRRGLAHHIWFKHVEIEVEHSDESLALALHFAQDTDGLKCVEYGMAGVLDANVKLYDGLLAVAQP
jgi:pyrroloquinoline quinone (PQQ) biosynthesis protein C